MSFEYKTTIPVTMSHSHFYKTVESFPHLEEKRNHHHHKEGHKVDEFFDHKEKIMSDLR